MSFLVSELFKIHPRCTSYDMICLSLFARQKVIKPGWFNHDSAGSPWGMHVIISRVSRTCVV